MEDDERIPVALGPGPWAGSRPTGELAKLADLRKDDPAHRGRAVEAAGRGKTPIASRFATTTGGAWRTMTFRRGGRGGARDRGRAGGARASSREIGSACCRRRGSSGCCSTSGSCWRGASRCRSTPPTPPSSASSSCATRARRSSWSRTRPSATSCSGCAITCSRCTGLSPDRRAAPPPVERGAVLRAVARGSAARGAAAGWAPTRASSTPTARRSRRSRRSRSSTPPARPACPRGSCSRTST